MGNFQLKIFQHVTEYSQRLIERKQAGYQINFNVMVAFTLHETAR